jgi:magnesium chelatase family protein
MDFLHHDLEHCSPILGLAGSAVLEARERVRAALRNSGFEVPARRITVNLAPADLPKEGTGHDLAMAAAILVASGQLEADLGRVALIGELALDGSLRPIPGAMALVAAARGAGILEAIVPFENGPESAAIGGVVVRPAACFSQVVRHLARLSVLERLEATLPSRPAAAREDAPDLASVIGQRVGRRALEVAMAGRHNLAFVGPPGVGKTLLARAGAGLLPPLAEDEAAEVSRIHSVAGVADSRAPVSPWPPFRAPHHTISMQALVGGGPRVRPGEASLAHRGVLFLDETLQFRTDAIDALRGPIDAGIVLIARVDGTLALPARFMLLAAFNPCPCGWFGVDGRECRCEDGTRRRYQARLSGPMRDRLDLVIPLEPSVRWLAHDVAETPATVAARVAAANDVQRARQGRSNGELTPGDLDAERGFGAPLLGLMELRGRQMGLSLRRLHRAARVARTIADLEGSSHVARDHLDEALQHRPKELAA